MLRRDSKRFSATRIRADQAEDATSQIRGERPASLSLTRQVSHEASHTAANALKTPAFRPSLPLDRHKFNNNPVDDAGDATEGIGQLYPLSELPLRKWMPRKNSKPIAFCTVLRWALSGKGGVKLRSLMVGGTRCTCDTWAMTFFEQITGTADPVPQRTPLRRARQIDRAEAALAEAGNMSAEQASDAEKFAMVQSFAATLYAEMARAGAIDPAAAETQIVQNERALGLIRADLENIPQPYRAVCEALAAEANRHSVVFVGFPPRGDALRFRAAFILASRFPQFYSVVARGYDGALIRNDNSINLTSNIGAMN